eukprot:3268471-Rhodomonas_salina.1
MCVVTCGAADMHGSRRSGAAKTVPSTATTTLAGRSRAKHAGTLCSARCDIQYYAFCAATSSSDLDCAAIRQILQNPVTLSCGHPGRLYLPTSMLRDPRY